MSPGRRETSRRQRQTDPVRGRASQCPQSQTTGRERYQRCPVGIAGHVERDTNGTRRVLRVEEANPPVSGLEATCFVFNRRRHQPGRADGPTPGGVVQQHKGDGGGSDPALATETEVDQKEVAVFLKSRGAEPQFQPLTVRFQIERCLLGTLWITVVLPCEAVTTDVDLVRVRHAVDDSRPLTGGATVEVQTGGGWGSVRCGRH